MVYVQLSLKAQLDHSQAHGTAIEALQRRLEGQISAHNLQKEQQGENDAHLVTSDAHAAPWRGTWSSS